MDRESLLKKETDKYNEAHLKDKYGGRTARAKWFKRTVDPFHLVVKEGLINSSTMLDVGCGKGYFMDFFKNEYKHLDIMGMDISQVAKDSRPDLDIVICHAGDMSFDGDSFDFVAHMDGLEHILPEMQEDVMLEELRVAKKYIYHTIAIHSTPMDKKLIKQGLDPLHINLRTFKEWKEIFEKFTRENNLKLRGIQMDEYGYWVHVFIEI